jgi:hypothetical protein
MRVGYARGWVIDMARDWITLGEAAQGIEILDIRCGRCGDASDTGGSISPGYSGVSGKWGSRSPCG